MSDVTPNDWNTEWEQQQAIEAEKEAGIDADASRLARLHHDVRVAESDYAEASSSLPERANMSPEEAQDRQRYREQVHALDQQITDMRGEREALRKRVLNSATYKAEMAQAKDQDEVRRIMQRYGSPSSLDQD